ncbi:MAG: hypothetical protein OXI87_17495 [Albidovulum sp.]|nr:hypothetical protein [Albidovulum sp.]
MAPPLIPFQIGIEQLPGWASGDLIRHGAILKDKNTGRIVAHLQETGLFQELALNGASTLSNVANPVSAIAGTAGVVQNEQIKNKLGELQQSIGGVQNLQIVGLGLNMIGIGVTVASTLVILSRLREVSSAIDRIEKKVDALPQRWHELRLKEKILDLQTELERLEESSKWQHVVPVTQHIERDLDHSFNIFLDGSVQIASDKSDNIELLLVLLHCLSVCADAQFKALLEMEEMDVASARSIKHCQKLEQLFWHVPGDRLFSIVGTLQANRIRCEIEQDSDCANLTWSDRPAEYAEEFRRRLIASQAMQPIEFMQELYRRVSSRPHLVSSIRESGLNGKEYFDIARADKNNLLLLLKTVNQN